MNDHCPASYVAVPGTRSDGSNQSAIFPSTLCCMLTPVLGAADAAPDDARHSASSSAKKAFKPTPRGERFEDLRRSPLQDESSVGDRSLVVDVLARMASVDVSEQTDDVVAEELLELRIEIANDLLRHAEHMVLLRTDEPRAVLKDHAEPATLRIVRPAAVKDRADEEHDGSGGDRRADPRCVIGRALARPFVAPGDDDRRAVVLCEIVKCPHGVENELAVRTGERVYAIVRVQHLRLLARPDRDADGSAQLEARAEDLVAHARDEWIDCLRIEDARLCEDRVDALGDEPLEVVASGWDARKDALEIGLLRLDVVRR